MKYLIPILFIMASVTATAQDGTATTEKKTFSRTTEISTVINSDASTIWNLLTNAANYPNWNSTVISIDGEIKLGEKIKLVSSLDSSRTFKLKVKEFETNKKLIWGDGLGQRVYTLSKVEGGVQFSMVEKIGGFMFPLFAKKIPSFDESFEQFVADLKKAAEE